MITTVFVWGESKPVQLGPPPSLDPRTGSAQTSNMLLGTTFSAGFCHFLTSTISVCVCVGDFRSGPPSTVTSCEWDTFSFEKVPFKNHTLLLWLDFPLVDMSNHTPWNNSCLCSKGNKIRWWLREWKWSVSCNQAKEPQDPAEKLHILKVLLWRWDTGHQHVF